MTQGYYALKNEIVRLKGRIVQAGRRIARNKNVGHEKKVKKKLEKLLAEKQDILRETLAAVRVQESGWDTTPPPEKTE